MLHRDPLQKEVEDREGRSVAKTILFPGFQRIYQEVPSQVITTVTYSLWRSYYVLGTVLSLFRVLPHLIFY